jgi:hypothetical protein
MKLLIRVVSLFVFILLWETIRFMGSIAYLTLSSDFEDILDCKLLKDSHNLGKNIFFTESSGVKNNVPSILASLDSRYACCVEAAAAMNPNYNVFVVFVSRTQLADSKQIRALKKYKNVKFVGLDLNTFSENTPMEKWVKSGKLLESVYSMEVGSDLLRIMLLWR